MPVGPASVAFHLVMSVSDGKAESPGVGDIIRVMSSDWRLGGRSEFAEGSLDGGDVAMHTVLRRSHCLILELDCSL